MRKIKDISKVILMIGAMLFSGDLVAFQTFSHPSSTESRIEVETIEEGEVRGFITRSRQVVRVCNLINKRIHHFSSSFNRALIESTADAKAYGTLRFIQYCSFLN